MRVAVPPPEVHHCRDRVSLLTTAVAGLTTFRLAVSGKTIDLNLSELLFCFEESFNRIKPEDQFREGVA